MQVFVPGVLGATHADEAASHPRTVPGDQPSPGDESLSRLFGILPYSLVRTIEELAEHEGCSAYALLIDLIRSEVASRSRAMQSPSDSREEGLHARSNLFDWQPPVPKQERTKSGRAIDSMQAHPPSPGHEPITNLPDIVRPSAQNWAIVVAQDANGRPQEQVVQSDSVVPLDLEDFTGLEGAFGS